MKRCIIVAVVILLGMLGANAQEQFTSGDGAITFTLPAGFIVDESGGQFFVRPPSVSNPRSLEPGDIALVLAGPDMVTQQVHNAHEVSVLEVAEGFVFRFSGQDFSPVADTVIGGRGAAYFTYLGGDNGQRDEKFIAFEADDTGVTKLGLLALTVAGEMGNFDALIETFIASVTYDGASAGSVANLGDPDIWRNLETITAENAANLQLIAAFPATDDEQYYHTGTYYSALALGGYGDHQFVRTWDTLSGEFITTIDTSELSSNPAFVFNYTLGLISHDGYFLLLDADTGMELDRWIYDYTGFDEVVVSNDQALLALVTMPDYNPGPVLVVNAFTGEVNYVLDVAARRARFTADNSGLVVQAVNNGIQSLILFDAATGEQVRVLAQVDGFINDFAVHPNGSVLYVLNISLVSVDLESGAVLREWNPGDIDSYFYTVDISDDGSLIFLTDDPFVVVLDGETHEFITALQREDHYIEEIDIAGGQGYLVVISNNGAYIYGVPGN